MTEVTPNILKALKRADYLTIDWARSLTGERTAARCTLVRRADEPLQHDLDFRFDIDATARPEHSWKNNGQCLAVAAYFRINLYRFEQVYFGNSILGLLRKGDNISFQFYPGAGSESLEDAGFVVDLLVLHIRRGKKIMEFHLDQEIVPRNSGLRPIKVERA